MSGGRAAPWGMGVPLVAGVGELGPGGNEVGGKGGRDGGDGGGGLRRKEIPRRRDYCSDLIS